MEFLVPPGGGERALVARKINGHFVSWWFEPRAMVPGSCVFCSLSDGRHSVRKSSGDDVCLLNLAACPSADEKICVLVSF